MKSSTTVNKLALYLSWIVGLIIVLLPFHAFLTVWLASGIGHYTALRLWKEFLLVILVVGTAILLYQDVKLRRSFIKSNLTRLIFVYSGLSIIWGAIAYNLDKVSLKALGYGLIVNLRFL